MIFVILGNHTQPFYRLLKKVDQLKADKIIDDVFLQIGYSDYQPKYCSYEKFVGFNKFQDLIKQSEIIITHAGAGSLINILSHDKPAVVIPRMKKYDEHTNDHQIQLTKELDKQGRIIAVYEIETLGDAVDKARNFQPQKQRNSSNVVELIEGYLDKCDLANKTN